MGVGPKLSVITIVKGRAKHLSCVLQGLARSTILPHEVIVVRMDDVHVEASPCLPVIVIEMPSDGIPLAAARNRGAKAASGEHFLFLDVDCIPRKDLISRMSDELVSENSLACAEVRYLGPDDGELIKESDLMAAARCHPHRVFPPDGRRYESNAGLFWSLAFGIRQKTFVSLGGFDEGYEGYGAEDTDFGFRAKKQGIPLVFLGGTGAFHQYHGVQDPPLQHLEDIVRNAKRFYLRWRKWPMRGWLEAFAAMGLIEWETSTVALVRHPTEAEIASSVQRSNIYF